MNGVDMARVAMHVVRARWQARRVVRALRRDALTDGMVAELESEVELAWRALPRHLRDRSA